MEVIANSRIIWLGRGEGVVGQVAGIYVIILWRKWKVWGEKVVVGNLRKLLPMMKERRMGPWKHVELM